MKQNDADEINENINANNFANMFNVYKDSDVDNAYTYAINRTLNVQGLPEDPTDDYNNSMFIYHTIQHDDTWKLISYKAYDTIDLWWMICKVNNIIDPTDMPEIGATIRILSRDLVNDMLNNLRTL
jgi:hypothetical protein